MAGKPNASTFPFTELSFKARSPTDPSQELSLNIVGADLELGLQYNEAAGVQKLRDWLYGLQERAHGRKRGEGWQISVGSGSLDLIFKVMLGASFLYNFIKLLFTRLCLLWLIREIQFLLNRLSTRELWFQRLCLSI